MSDGSHLGFYKHDHLPHFDEAGLIQFVTFVMADAAPSERLRTGMRMMNRDGDLMFFKMESLLDNNAGSCLLAKEWAAKIVVNEILTLDEMLLAWVVMPNHVHLLYRQGSGETLGKTIQRIKSRASMLINRRLGRQGKFWQSGNFDRCMRDIEHVQRTIEYIHNNPVKGGLVNQESQWKHSSFRNFDPKKTLQIFERTFIGAKQIR
jgi:REP element-mobilizing transposase RayT